MGKFESGGTKNEKKTAEKLTPQKSFLLYLHDLIYLLAVVVLLFLLFFRIVVVSGESMYQTLRHNDFLLLVNNVFYQQPEYGDIVVISKDDYDNGTPIVKRIIATEGQTVDIDFAAGVVYIDGVALEETSYTYTPTTKFDPAVSFPITVDEGCIFVLGDNRAESLDSRYEEIGQIDEREILGKAIFLIFPGDRNGREERDFSRIGAIS